LSYFLCRKGVAKFKLFIVYSEGKTVIGPLEIKLRFTECQIYEGWNFNSGNYLFTTDTK